MLLKLNLPVYFYFLNVATRNFKITHGTSHCGSHYISTGPYQSKAIKCSQQWLSNSWAFSRRMASVESALQKQLWGCLLQEARGGRNKALMMSRGLGKPGAGLGLQAASFSRQQGGVQGPGYKGMVTGQKAPKWCRIRPERPATCLPVAD